ncbi:hypothetical protein NUSPORA_00668 [Nucleospora cyclopteri]
MPTIATDLKIKVKQSGYVFGDFAGFTKNGIRLNKAVIGLNGNLQAKELSIVFSDILTCQRVKKVNCEKFKDEELLDLANIDGCQYKEEALKEAYKRGLLIGPEDGGKKEWDQFESNYKLHGISPEFDLSEYTIEIDRNAPDYKQKYAKSKKIAEEIMNVEDRMKHEREEKKGAKLSEEAKYSMVSDSSLWSKDRDEKKATKFVEETKPAVSHETNLWPKIKDEKKVNKSAEELKTKVEKESLKKLPAKEMEKSIVKKQEEPVKEIEKPKLPDFNVAAEEEVGGNKFDKSCKMWGSVNSFLMEKTKIMPKIITEPIKEIKPQKEHKEKPQYIPKEKMIEIKSEATNKSMETSVSDKPNKSILSKTERKEYFPSEIIKITTEGFSKRLVAGFKPWGNKDETVDFYIPMNENKGYKKEFSPHRYSKYHEKNL